MKSVLLHICCGICALHSIARLKQEGFFVEGYFFNPNIQPEEEYLRRKSAIAIVKNAAAINIIEGEYDSSNWLSICGEYPNEPEGGQRCLLCYQLRLKAAYDLSVERKFDFFATTLTISPHKKSKIIFDIGKRIGGKNFLEIDFKKKDGFKLTMTLANQLQIYHQSYCGCLYSKAHLK